MRTHATGPKPIEWPKKWGLEGWPYDGFHTGTTRPLHGLETRTWARLSSALARKHGIGVAVCRERLGGPKCFQAQEWDLDRLRQCIKALGQVSVSRRVGPIDGWPGMTWGAADNHLRTHHNFSLARFVCEVLGISGRNSWDLKGLKKAIRGHYRRYGKPPTQESGSIGDLPGKTWAGADGFLKREKEMSLPILCAKVLRRGRKGVWDLSQIESAVRRHYRTHGKAPSTGPIEGWPGKTWDGADHFLRGQGKGGLPDFASALLGLVKRSGWDLDDLEARIRVYYRKNHRLPTKRSGQVEGLLPKVWSGADQYLHMYFDTSLLKFGQERLGVTHKRTQTAETRAKLSAFRLAFYARRRAENKSKAA